MNQSDIELAKEIKRLIAKSSPLPWAAVGWNNDRRRNLEIKAKDNTAIATIWRVSCTCIDGHQYKNDKLILHGVNALPRLCKAILQAQEEIEQLTNPLPEDNPDYDSCGCRYEKMGYGPHIPKRVQVCLRHKLLEEENKQQAQALLDSEKQNEALNTEITCLDLEIERLRDIESAARHLMSVMMPEDFSMAVIHEAIKKLLEALQEKNDGVARDY